MKKLALSALTCMTLMCCTTPPAKLASDLTFSPDSSVLVPIEYLQQDTSWVYVITEDVDSAVVKKFPPELQYDSVHLRWYYKIPHRDLVHHELNEGVWFAFTKKKIIDALQIIPEDGAMIYDGSHYYYNGEITRMNEDDDRN